MSDDLPQPLTPPDSDLRGLEWMPLYGHRLFASDFDAHASDAEFRAAMTLWWAAWNQVPAASLADDEVALCRLAGLGRDLASWRVVRPRALHGFVRCSDGRLYHRAMAPIAVESWEHRRKERARRQRWRQKAVCGDVPRDVAGTADTTGQDTTGQDMTPARPPDEKRSANGLRAMRPADLAMPDALREAPDGKRLKRQDIADRDMVRWLTTKGGMDGQRAWALLMAARDAEDEAHGEAARELERISRTHRLGWFAQDAA